MRTLTPPVTVRKEVKVIELQSSINNNLTGNPYGNNDSFNNPISELSLIWPRHTNINGKARKNTSHSYHVA